MPTHAGLLQQTGLSISPYSTPSAMATSLTIQEIRAFGLCGSTPEGGWSHELRPEGCVHTLIAVYADGLVGWGSVFTNDDLVRASLAVLRPLFEGENALEPDRLSEKLHQYTFWQGRGGSITHTISGIDMALWDILGKACGQSVGRFTRLPRSGCPTNCCPSKLRASAPSRSAGGLSGNKAPPWAVGPDSLLMVDAGASDSYWPQGYKWALRSAEMLTDYGVAWFEEPLLPDALEDFVALRRAARVPIAGGEVLTRRQSFQPWLDDAAFDIVQPDVTKVGGLSEQRRIGWIAREHGVRFISHGWNTAVGLASDLQMASAFADTDLVEYLTGSPFIDQIAAGGWKLDTEGFLPIPDIPGLRIEINPDALALLGTFHMR